MLDSVVRDERDARYASHVPVLRAWLAGGRWRIVEFGCGRFSTPVLAEYAESLECWEKSPSWIRDVAELVPDATYRAVPATLPEFEAAFSAAIDRQTVVFVDGAPVSWRVSAIQQAQRKAAPVIFAHDWSTTQKSYGYDRLKAREDYRIHAYKCGRSKVKTAVFVRCDSPIVIPATVEGHSPCT